MRNLDLSNLKEWINFLRSQQVKVQIYYGNAHDRFEFDGVSADFVNNVKMEINIR